MSELQKLMRITYLTDATAEDPEYRGSMSTAFPAEHPQSRIVDVDWSTRGEVTVTWLIPAQYADVIDPVTR
jgi:hypothetical protein